MSPLWSVTGLISTALMLLIIAQLQRRSYFRHYPFLSLLIFTQLFITIAQWGLWMRLYNLSDAGYARLYWTTAFVTQALLITVMMAFIYRALTGIPNRWRTMALVVLVVAVSAGLTLVSLGPAGLGGGRWPSFLLRNLSFGTALLNVFLWQSLLKHRRSDVQLLLLALGIGLLTTGSAIGQSLRLISSSEGLGDAAVVLTELLCLLIWFWSLSRFRLAGPAAAANSQTTSNPQPTTPV